MISSLYDDFYSEFSLYYLLQGGFNYEKFQIHTKNMIKLNKYVNVLEKFQKKHKIEYDTYLKAKFKKGLKK